MIVAGIVILLLLKCTCSWKPYHDNCLRCPKGYGLYPECNPFVKKYSCFRCGGEKYSDTVSPEICKTSRKCGLNEKDDPWTPNANRECHCIDNFTREKKTLICTQCCECETSFLSETDSGCLENKNGHHCLAKTANRRCKPKNNVPSAVSVSSLLSPSGAGIKVSMKVSSTASIRNHGNMLSTDAKFINWSKTVPEAVKTRNSSKTIKKMGQVIKTPPLVQWIATSSTPSISQSTTKPSPNSSKISTRNSKVIIGVEKPDQDRSKPSVDVVKVVLVVCLVVLALVFLIWVIIRVKKRYEKKRKDDELPSTSSLIRYSDINENDDDELPSTNVTISDIDHSLISKLKGQLEPNGEWKKLGQSFIDSKVVDEERKKRFLDEVDHIDAIKIGERFLIDLSTSFTQETVESLKCCCKKLHRNDIVERLESVQVELLKDLPLEDKNALILLLDKRAPSNGKVIASKYFNHTEVANLVEQRCHFDSHTEELVSILKMQLPQESLIELAKTANNLGYTKVKNTIENFVKSKTH